MHRLIFLTSLLFYYGCGGGGGGGNDTPTYPTPTDSTFSSGIQPIFNNYCISCHQSGGAASFLPLTNGVSYGNLINQPATLTGNPPGGTLVVPSNSANSVLYQRVSGTGLAAGEATMPQGNPLLSTTNQDLIKAWIDDGAQNN